MSVRSCLESKNPILYLHSPSGGLTGGILASITTGKDIKNHLSEPNNGIEIIEHTDK